MRFHTDGNRRYFYAYNPVNVASDKEAPNQMSLRLLSSCSVVLPIKAAGKRTIHRKLEMATCITLLISP